MRYAVLFYKRGLSFFIVVKLDEGSFEVLVITGSGFVCGHKRYLLLVSHLIVSLFFKRVHFYKYNAYAGDNGIAFDAAI